MNLLASLWKDCVENSLFHEAEWGFNEEKLTDRNTSGYCMRQRFLPMMRNWMFLFVYLLPSYSSRCSNHTEIQNLFCYQWEFKNHEHSSFLQEATRIRGQIGLLASSADNIELLSCNLNRLGNTSWAMWNKLPFSFLAFLPPLFFLVGLVCVCFVLGCDFLFLCFVLRNQLLFCESLSTLGKFRKKTLPIYCWHIQRFSWKHEVYFQQRARRIVQKSLW